MNEKHKSLFESYIKDLKRVGHRPKGIENLFYRIKRYFLYIEEKNLDLFYIRVCEAQDYQGWIFEKGQEKGIKYTNATVETYIIAAVSFYDFLKRKKLVHTNPFKEIRRVKTEKPLPKNLLKEKEMNIFLNQLSKFDEKSHLKERVTRFKVWIVAELMYATGLRIAEVCNLKRDDIDFDRSIIHVEGKMGINRVCYLGEYSMQLLKLYIDEFRDLIFTEWNKRNGDLLFGVKYNHFEKIVNKVLKNVLVKLGYPCFTSHNFRHCLGFHLLRRGCDIRHIQAILGHRMLRSTEIYTKVEKDDLKKVFDKYHPRTYLRRRKDE